MEVLGMQIGEMEFDGLITDITPKITFGGATLGADVEDLKRGTVLIYDDTVPEDETEAVGVRPIASGDDIADFIGILTDDTQKIIVNGEEVEDGATEKVVVYKTGCFDPDRLIFGTFTVTDAAKAALEQMGVTLKKAQ